MSKDEKKGFEVKDKRGSHEESCSCGCESKKQDEVEGEDFVMKEEKDSTQNSIPPEMSFSTLIFSLSSTALVYLGDMPNPSSNKYEQNYAVAKQNIDILGMLKDKTKGNLSADEDKLLDTLLSDLRLRYVDKISKKG